MEQFIRDLLNDIKYANENPGPVDLPDEIAERIDIALGYTKPKDEFKMRWIYDSHDNHKNEVWYKCSNCGHEDWWCSYYNPNLEKVQCEKCKSTPN